MVPSVPCAPRWRPWSPDSSLHDLRRQMHRRSYGTVVRLLTALVHPRLAMKLGKWLQGVASFAFWNRPGRNPSHDLCSARSLRLTPPDSYCVIHCGTVLFL
ncbi:hypothetical protein IG631_18294 [Alternaria alternata]|nr:hypothetical protein IG631_18294 [Alternaria alternata]